jgi:drug/metabolite transporter (DMT)-like permease
MSDIHLGFLLSVGALLLFTVAIVVTKVASSRIQLGLGFLIATVVNVVFAGLALAVQLAFSRDALSWNAQAFWLFVAAGAFSTYLGRWFFYESVVRFGPAKASIFQVSSPLFTAVIAWSLLGESLGRMVLLGMVFTVAGLMMVAYQPGFLSRSQSPANEVPAVQTSLHSRLLRSIFLLGLGSSLAYSIGNVLRGSAVRSWPEPLLGAWLGAVSGLLLHLAFTSGRAGLVARLQDTDRKGVWLYVLIGVSTISAQVCVIASMQYIPLAVATLVTLCTPILVFPISHWLLKTGEQFTPLMLSGSALAMLGIFIIVTR